MVGCITQIYQDARSNYIFNVLNRIANLQTYDKSSNEELLFR